MSHPRDRDLALWAGGDLPVGEAERIAEHLSACPSCRALADGLRASRDGLEALGAEPVDPAALVRIRARVRDGVRRHLAEEAAPAGWSAGRSRTALWPWALAAALALAALGLGIWYRTAGSGEPERLARADRPEPAEVVREVAPHPPPETPAEGAETPSESPGEPSPRKPSSPEAGPQTGRRPEPAARPDEATPPPPEPTAPVQRADLPPEPVRPTEPTVIKVVSDDPDIVYYWLVEPEESEDETVSS